MRTYEYLRKGGIAEKEPTIEEINQLAQAGWEIDQMVPLIVFRTTENDVVSGATHVYIFRREVPASGRATFHNAA